MSEIFWKILEFMFDHGVLSLVTIILILAGLGLMIVKAGGGTYLAYGLIGFYLLACLGDMINNLWRDKYLREQKNNKED